MSNNIIKSAAGDQEFEQAFFQLAYDKLQGKLSNLVPFLVGFQLVKKSDNDTKAVGVFGFKSNNGQILFVPAFFINGKIKELEILYSRNNNQFYPLNEDFADLFLKDDVTGLGSVSKQRKEEIQRDITNPNMRNVIWPPRTGRISYAEAKDLEEQNTPVFEKSTECLLSKKAYITSPQLIDFVKQGDNQVKEAFWTLMTKNAEFTDAVRSFYKDEQIADALKVSPIIKEAKKKKLKVVEFEEGDFRDLSEHTKKDVATKGYGIVDQREDGSVSEVGMFKFTETFTNPVSSGFYPYITQLGTLRYGLVLVSVENLITGYTHPKAIVVDLESKRKGQAYECELSDVFIKGQITIKDLSKILHLLEEPAEVMPGYEDYVLINDRLKCTEPFRVLENFKDSSGIRRIKVEPTWYAEGHPRIQGEQPADNQRTNHGHTVLVLTKKPGDRLEHRNRAIYIPKGYRLLKVHLSKSYYPLEDYSKTKEERDQERVAIDAERSRISEGVPGDLSYLASVLRAQNTFPLTVHTNGSDYFLDIGGAKVTYDNPIEAKIAMVTEVGLREKIAEEVINSLIPNIKRKGYIKIAALGDQTLHLQDEQPENNEFGQPTYYGVPWIDMHDQSDGYTQDPTRQGLGVKPDEASLGQTVNQAVQLAQNGQKEVFDTQAISSLSKYTNSTDKVLQYVPNFVSTLDKLGRMLFLAYWDTDTFEEMYGKDELPELIELVKSVFNNLGDLVIFLKRKVPDLSINDNEQSKNDT